MSSKNGGHGFTFSFAPFLWPCFMGKKHRVERSTFDPCHRLNPDCRMNPGPNARALELPGADKRRFVFSALHGSGASVTTGAPAVCAGFHLGGTPPGCSWPLDFFFNIFFGCFIDFYFLAKRCTPGSCFDLWEPRTFGFGNPTILFSRAILHPRILLLPVWL